jgi:hypothetical protein
MSAFHRNEDTFPAAHRKHDDPDTCDFMMSDLSLPTIQRMEASEGVIRGNVDSLMKLAAALDASGIELISDNATSSSGGRGVRFKRPPA